MEINGGAACFKPTSSQTRSAALGNSGCQLSFRGGGRWGRNANKGSFHLVVHKHNILSSAATLCSDPQLQKYTCLLREGVVKRFRTWSWRSHGFGLKKSQGESDVVLLLFRMIKNLCLKNTAYRCPQWLSLLKLCLTYKKMAVQLSVRVQRNATDRVTIQLSTRECARARARVCVHVCKRERERENR